MLTDKEKNLLREIICNQQVSPELLADMAEKSEDEIRQIVGAYKADKMARMQGAIARLQAEIVELSQ